MDKGIKKAHVIIAAQDPGRTIESGDEILDALRVLLGSTSPKDRTTACIFIRDRLRKIYEQNRSITSPAENVLIAYAFNAEGVGRTLESELDDIALRIVIQQMSKCVGDMIQKYGCYNPEDVKDFRQQANELFWVKRKGYDGRNTFQAYITKSLRNCLMNMTNSDVMGMAMSDHDIKMLNHVIRHEKELQMEGIESPTNKQIADRIEEKGYKHKTSLTMVAAIQKRRYQKVSYDDPETGLFNHLAKESLPEEEMLRADLREHMWECVETFEDPLRDMFRVMYEYYGEADMELSHEELHRRMTKMPRYRKYSKADVRRLRKALNAIMSEEMADYRPHTWHPKAVSNVSNSFISREERRQEAEDILRSITTDQPDPYNFDDLM